MNWEWSKSHIKQTLLDGIGLLPIIGVFKYGDEAADVVKNGSKAADKMDDIKDVGEKVVKGGGKTAEKIFNQGKEVLDNFDNGTVKSVTDNGLTKAGNASYEIIIDAGKEVGTRGETLVKIVLSEDGGMLSAYPIK
jgi:hypothetical protein